ncbi:MAG TPA: Ig-like domain-containing protein [Leptospiraceae bacterium]|nr:Ig-like domain-containing protein [Leptospiraceae bacterium]HNF12507.1 Ig-like domain-containing protein [Leptospiraceae bacterium]HNF23119.1 Ig-like domain-containing protein [Leptospiraceae bacterium]HNI94725.1 Ig-like domain-containing protein [Leptospiraceae bacterium]HNM02632.1 Ig-like domain-containing protein [Leptospiraceae bacterium]
MNKGFAVLILLLFQFCSMSISRKTAELLPKADLLFRILNISKSGFTVSGTVSGLTSEGLILSSGTSPNVTVSVASGSASFQFAGTFADGTVYKITASSVPSTQSCTVQNGSGTVSGANITNVSVTCYPNFPSVVSITPADGASNLNFSTFITLNFSGPMDISSLTVNTVDNNCNSTIQVSEDDFSSCIPLDSAVSSTGNSSVSFKAKFGYTYYKTVKVRVLSSAKNILGNNMQSAYTSSGFSGFSIAGLRIHFQSHSVYQSNSTNLLSWTDLSGNGNTVSQATGANQPLFLTNQSGVFPVIRFNNTNSLMKKLGGTGLGTLAGSYFFVFKRNLVTGINPVLQIGTDTGYANGRQFVISNLNKLEFNQKNISNLILSSALYTGTSSVYLYSLQSDGTNHTIQFSGNADGTATFSTGSYPGTDIELGYSGFDWLELIYYDSSLSAASRDQVNCYLGKKYNVTLSISCP